MSSHKRNAAVISAAAILAALGLGTVTNAQADSVVTPPAPSVGQTPSDDGGRADKAEPGLDREEPGETAEPEDGPDQGPDADPNEPGHQDADESGDVE